MAGGRLAVPQDRRPHPPSRGEPACGTGRLVASKTHTLSALLQVQHLSSRQTHRWSKLVPPRLLSNQPSHLFMSRSREFSLWARG